ncbi:MAG: hypothetical protein RBS43_00055 [Candidatus Cloacimonas sp.]|jgi:predicted transcriptional regulator|nr:hypothetical protein [Candidatus Cloacimonas sp.]
MQQALLLTSRFQKKGNWKYSTQVAVEIPNLLHTKSYRSIREIATAYGMSRQLIFVYLEAIASIGMVGIYSNVHLCKSVLALQKKDYLMR